MKILFPLISIVFLIIYLCTSYFNRYTGDDLLILSLLENNTANHISSLLYNTWCGRWFSIAVYTNLLYYFGNLKHFLLIFNSILITALIYAIFLNLKNLRNYNFHVYNNTQLISVSIVFVTLFFYSTFSIGQSWFWYSVSGGAYFINIVFYLLANSIMFKTTKAKVIDYLLIIIFALYIGSASEIASILFLCVSFILLIMFKENNQVKKTNTLFIILTLASFFFTINADGTTNRYVALNQSNLHLDLQKYLYLNFILSLKFIKIIPYALLYSLPFVYLGINSTNSTKTLDKTKQIIKTLFLFYLISIIYNSIIIYVMKDIGPDRVFLPINLMFAILVAITAFHVGKKSKNIVKNNYSQILALIVIIVLIVNTYKYYFIHKNYAEKYDERIEYLRKNNSKLISITPLPFSGYIYNAEITEDTLNFNNQCLKKYLKLKYSPKLKTNVLHSN